MDAGAMMVLPGEDFNRWRRISAFQPDRARDPKSKDPCQTAGVFSSHMSTSGID